MSESKLTVIVDECLLVIVTVWSNLKTFKSLLWEEKVENITCKKKENRSHTKKKKNTCDQNSSLWRRCDGNFKCQLLTEQMLL